MNAKSFSIKWAIVDAYKVIRKIHNDAKKSFGCRKSIGIFKNSVAPVV